MKRRPVEYGPRRRSVRGAPRLVLSARKELLSVDTGKIRRKALATYRRAEKTLGADKESLGRYHAHDVPGFRTWLHQTFGDLLARAREVMRLAGEKRALLGEIEWFCDRDGISESAAYRKVMWRHAHPEEAEAEDRQYEEQMRERMGGNEFGGEDDDDPFVEDDFEDVPGSEEEENFRNLFEELTGERLPPSLFGRPAARREKDRATVRELYRKIVRNLHPDHHGQMSEARQELWHEAQDAYRRRDEDALYGILARCDDGEGAIGPHSPVSLIQRMTRQLKKAARAIRSELHRAKADPAWNYEQKARDPHFVNRLRRGITADLSAAEGNLACVTAMLAQLERQANRPAPQPRKPRKVRQAAGEDLFQDLPF